MNEDIEYLLIQMHDRLCRVEDALARLASALALKPKTDRKVYMRDLMRKRRAEKKADGAIHA